MGQQFQKTLEEDTLIFGKRRRDIVELNRKYRPHRQWRSTQHPWPIEYTSMALRNALLVTTIISHKPHHFIFIFILLDFSLTVSLKQNPLKPPHFIFIYCYTLIFWQWSQGIVELTLSCYYAMSPLHVNKLSTALILVS